MPSFLLLYLLHLLVAHLFICVLFPLCSRYLVFSLLHLSAGSVHGDAHPHSSVDSQSLGEER